MQLHTRDRSTPTQEESLVRVPVNQALDGAVRRLMERVKGQLGVVGHHERLHRQELAKDWVVSRIGPVDTAQDIRPVKRLSVRAEGY
jgi:hypothetical protein